MNGGSGAVAATAVMALISLAFGRAGGIVHSRVRSAEASLSMMFGRPKQLEQRSPAARSCLLNCGVRRGLAPRCTVSSGSRRQTRQTGRLPSRQ